MKSYIEFFDPGGTIIPDKYLVELKDINGNPTGHKMIKGPEFVITEDIINFIKNFGKNIKKYVNIKKNLPKIDENSSTNFSPSIGTTISTASYKKLHPELSISFDFDNTDTSSDV